MKKTYRDQRCSPQCAAAHVVLCINAQVARTRVTTCQSRRPTGLTGELAFNVRAQPRCEWRHQVGLMVRGCRGRTRPVTPGSVRWPGHVLLGNRSLCSRRFPAERGALDGLQPRGIDVRAHIAFHMRCPVCLSTIRVAASSSSVVIRPLYAPFKTFGSPLCTPIANTAWVRNSIFCENAAAWPMLETRQEG